jgi:cob(I)alamin adenosyltransferase
MSSIATRRGDDGTTSLLYGQRVPKDHPQIEAVGAFDELNAALGFAKAAGAPAHRREQLEHIQKTLVNLMGEVAVSEEDLARYEASKFQKLSDADLAFADALVADLEGRGLRFDGWATPGANLYSGALEVARTIARRAERRLSALPAVGRRVRPLVRQYVNRVSDALWLLAREAEQPAS